MINFFGTRIDNFLDTMEEDDSFKGGVARVIGLTFIYALLLVAVTIVMFAVGWAIPALVAMVYHAAGWGPFILLGAVAVLTLCGWLTNGK